MLSCTLNPLRSNYYLQLEFSEGYAVFMIHTPPVLLSFKYRNATCDGTILLPFVHNPVSGSAAVHFRAALTPTWPAGTQSITVPVGPQFFGFGLLGLSFAFHLANALRKLFSSKNMVLSFCVGGFSSLHFPPALGLARIPLRCFQMCPPALQLTWETGLVTLPETVAVARHSLASTVLSPAMKRLIRTSQFAGW